MSGLIEAGKKSNVPQGGMMEIKIEGLNILLANVAGNIYAINNKCPHMGGNLAKGKLDGTVVTCPLHGSQFDVTNGKVIRWLKGSKLLSSIGKVFKPPDEVKSYNVKLDGDTIFIEL